MRWIFFAILLSASAASGQTPLPAFDSCTTLPACLDALDGATRGGAATLNRGEDYARRLAMFGAPAKQALLERAIGDDEAWRDLAGRILIYWPAFEAGDVPVLIRALKRQPGGWAARPLGAIGTPEAIAALVEDVRVHGGRSQSDYVLEKRGAAALPYLWPVLEDDTNWRDGTNIIAVLKDRVAPAIPGWVAIASDKTQPEKRRIAALRAIGAEPSLAKPFAPSIRKLTGNSGALEDAVDKVLLAMADETMVPQVIETCGASPDPFGDDYSPSECLTRVAAYGDTMLPYGNRILTVFADSRNGADRANAAGAVGYIGYRPAEAKLIAMLDDPDWRVVYAAARSLGWLGASRALPALRKTAKAHWLEAVREEAGVAITALRSPAGRLERPQIREGSFGDPPAVPDVAVSAEAAPDVEACESEVWDWQGKRFSRPENPQRELHVAGGTMAGRDQGEWGGELKWRSADGPDQILNDGNVTGIEPADGGIVAVFSGGGLYKVHDQAPETVIVSNGPEGSGYALRVTRDAGGAWRLAEIARLPRGAAAFTTVAPGLYAAWSGDRAVMFSDEKILGLAVCTAR